MRNTRRSGQAGLEFGGSGEDSFVAVVVTKLTGALLFILLLTMVIMALIPRAADLATSDRGPGAKEQPLEITTPEALPEAIAGRPYQLTLAATGARGPVRWSLTGVLPDGLTFDPETGTLQGNPREGKPPIRLTIRADDGARQASRTAELVVYQPDRPLTLPNRWAFRRPAVPVRAWLEQGFGFLVLLLVHLVGMNTLGNLERGRSADLPDEPTSVRKRFTIYRYLVRFTTLTALIMLLIWLGWHHIA